MATAQPLVPFQKKVALYETQGSAVKVWSCRAPRVLYVGPARTGKSRCLLERANQQAMRWPRARILLVRKTRGSMSESVLQTLEDEVFPPRHPIIMNGAKRSIRQEYIYPNGSRIIPGGMDNPDKVLSSEYDAIYVFESLELTESDFEVLTTRLSCQAMGDKPEDSYRQICLDCNPGSPTHWIRQRMLKGFFTVFESSHKDNPRLFDIKTKDWTPFGRSYITGLKQLTGVRKLRLYHGKWAAAEGVIFELKEESLKDPLTKPLPKEWRRIRVIDFGFTAPFVCLWIAIDPDGRMHVYRQIYMSRRLVADHAKLILLLSQGENIETTICDWDAEGRATLEAAGIPTVAAYKDFPTGRDQVQDRLKLAGDGEPRIYIYRDSLVEEDEMLREVSHPLCLEQEFDLYIYKKQVSKQVDDKLEKEEPIDKFNHGCDALRYAVAYVDELGTDVVQIQMESSACLPVPGGSSFPEKGGELVVGGEVINPVNYVVPAGNNEYVLPIG